MSNQHNQSSVTGMRNKIEYRILAGLLTIFLLSGCVARLSPIEVSDKFWMAVKNNDRNAIKKYIVADSGNDINSNQELLTVSNYTLGKTVIDQGQAWVDTNLEITGDDSFNLPIKTVLLQQDEQWKVDYQATIAPITGGSEVAKLLDNLNDLGLQFADKLNQSMDQLQDELPEIQRELDKIEENLKQKLPELQKRIEEFMQQLEEALGQKNRQKPPTGTKEI